jgi:hypothetical protein
MKLVVGEDLDRDARRGKLEDVSENQPDFLDSKRNGAGFSLASMPYRAVR